ncbi:MAG: hypothetical protein HRT45_18565, partial [Bdellovibrionales bacterium]|nr:hypothetical protein [Bdellovibrionales bacterium]
MKYLGLLLFCVCAFVVKGDQPGDQLDGLVEAIGVEVLDEELRLRNDDLDPCFGATNFVGATDSDRENCERDLRRNLALEAAEETFQEMQRHLCDGAESADLQVEECAHPLLNFYESIDELYQSTCQAYCQALVPASSHGLITCSQGVQCQNLSQREEELYAYGIECLQGARNGGAALVEGVGQAVESTLRIPYDAYMQLVFITQHGFHDWMLTALSNDIDRAGDTVRLIRAVPEMIRNQMRALRCMETEVARQYICQFATTAAATVATTALARRVALPEIERMIASMSYGDIVPGRPGGGWGDVSNLSPPELMIRLRQSPNGQRLLEELTDEEYEILEQALLFRSRETGLHAQLINELDTNDMNDLIEIIRRQAGRDVTYSMDDSRVEYLTAELREFLPERGSQIVGTPPLVDDFELTAEVRRDIDAASGIRTIDDTRGVDLVDIENRVELTVDRSPSAGSELSGYGILRGEVGELNGEPVFLKTSRADIEGGGNRSEFQVINESRMTQLLEEHGLGPR